MSTTPHATVDITRSACASASVIRSPSPAAVVALAPRTSGGLYRQNACLRQGPWTRVRGSRSAARRAASLGFTGPMSATSATDARQRLIAELREHALVIGEVTLTSGQ